MVMVETCEPQPAAPTARIVPPRLLGKTFVVDRKLGHVPRKQLIDLIEAEGGTVASAVDASVHYVVKPAGRAGGSITLWRAVARFNRGGASIQLIDVAKLHEMLLLSRDEGERLLRGQNVSRDRWRRLLPPEGSGLRLNLARANLRDADLSGFSFRHTSLSNADLRGANLSGAELEDLDRVGLDGARLEEAVITGAVRCTFDGLMMTRAWLRGRFAHCRFGKADLTDANLSEAVLQGCDLSGANLERGYLDGIQAAQANFREAGLRGTRFCRAKLTGADLAGADLSGANLMECDLSGAMLAGANLQQADLRRANLSRADLSGADLTGANLLDAQLQGARLDGAKRQDLPDPEEETAAAREDAAGFKLRLAALESTAEVFERLELNAVLEPPDQEPVPVCVVCSAKGRVVRTVEQTPDGVVQRAASSLEQAFTELAARYPGAEIPCNRIETEMTFSASVPPARVERLACETWAEFFNLQVARPAAPRKAQTNKRPLPERAELLAELRGGPLGISGWNARPKAHRKRSGWFHELDLTEQKLAGVNLEALDFSQAHFDDADLGRANLHEGNFTRATFRRANLQEANAGFARCAEADFREATLSGANLRYADLQEARFAGANLTGADLRAANLCGADLSSATLTGANLDLARADRRTRFPEGLALPESIRWQGPSPEEIQAVDFPTFQDRLSRLADVRRLGRALDMLKAERFQLYAQVEDDRVCGVVASQREEDLVYACWLTEPGSFCCYNHHLEACLGMRGQPCKHLLVLVLGLARAGKLPPALAERWLSAAYKKKPSAKRDQASEVLLRYHSAKAGQLDWRPTETLPEDFYAL
jgi:uncharacterized protein YjbI with pentapeptide repeats